MSEDIKNIFAENAEAAEGLPTAERLATIGTETRLLSIQMSLDAVGAAMLATHARLRDIVEATGADVDLANPKLTPEEQEQSTALIQRVVEGVKNIATLQAEATGKISEDVEQASKILADNLAKDATFADGPSTADVDRGPRPFEDPSIPTTDSSDFPFTVKLFEHFSDVDLSNTNDCDRFADTMEAFYVEEADDIEFYLGKNLCGRLKQEIIGTCDEADLIEADMPSPGAVAMAVGEASRDGGTTATIQISSAKDAAEALMSAYMVSIIRFERAVNTYRFGTDGLAGLDTVAEKLQALGISA